MAPVERDEVNAVTLDAVMVTDVGVVRDHNEDSAHIDGAREFFIVADGMGGHAAGEVASAMAVETVQQTIEGARPTIESFTKSPSDSGRREIVQLLQNAVLAAHQAVYQRGNRESDKQGMGTTLDVVLIAGHEAFVAHVGDSRTYLIRDGRAAQITTDHTVAEVLVIEGKLSIEEAQVSPLRTILVNAIGVSADVGVEMAHLQLRRGDRILLCSDGLHDYFVAEQEIADKLSEADPGRALGEMVEMAKERGGHDNITGVVINVVDVASSEAVPGVIELDQTHPGSHPRGRGRRRRAQVRRRRAGHRDPRHRADDRGHADRIAAARGAAAGHERPALRRARDRAAQGREQGRGREDPRRRRRARRRQGGRAGHRRPGCRGQGRREHDRPEHARRTGRRRRGRRQHRQRRDDRGQAGQAGSRSGRRRPRSGGLGAERRRGPRSQAALRRPQARQEVEPPRGAGPRSEGPSGCDSLRPRATPATM
jgi:serine/threonine protein phosphatase PrpC